VNKKDYIIVGQGIAGSLLGWFLIKQNKSVIVIDDAKPNTSSRVAAGIIHPVTGRRIVKTWMADRLVPFAEEFYREIENYFQVKIFHPMHVVELISSIKEFNDWTARSDEQELGTYIDPLFDGSNYDEYLQPFFKKILVKKSSWIDTTVLLDQCKNYFSEKGSYLNEKFHFENLLLSETGVAYKDIAASKIIFCDGVEALNNPYWKHLPFIPSKGEMITVKAEMKLEHIVNRKIFILPIANNLYKVGSTYSWKFDNDTPTPEAKEALIAQLKSVIKIPFEIVDQSAGIRPTVKDRRPMLGLHKQFHQVGIFNGLGTKGCLLAPFFADHLAGFLTGKNNLIKEIDVSLLSDTGQ
jgi:glycine oxidase